MAYYRDRLKLVVQITNVATGEVRDYTNEVEGSWVDGLPYMWSKGNYSCDCNRCLFWHRAAGEDDPDEEGPCGSDERFTINTAAKLSGKPFDLSYS